MRESPTPAGPVTLCVLLWARPGAESGLIAYEDQVLDIASGYGGRVLQRARSERRRRATAGDPAAGVPDRAGRRGVHGGRAGGRHWPTSATGRRQDRGDRRPAGRRRSGSVTPAGRGAPTGTGRRRDAGRGVLDGCGVLDWVRGAGRLSRGHGLVMLPVPGSWRSGADGSVPRSARECRCRTGWSWWGQGFGGIGMAIALKQAGIEDFVVLDKADDLGGTWRDNSYPGLCCDVPSQLYSYSFRPWRWRPALPAARGDPGLPARAGRRARPRTAPALRRRGRGGRIRRAPRGLEPHP